MTAMHHRTLLFSAVTVLVALGGCSQGGFAQLTNPGECRTLIDMGQIPPRSDAECAQYDAGMARQREELAGKNAADMAVIDDYFRRYPNAPRPAECIPIVGMPIHSEVAECRRIVKLTAPISAYFEAHPNAPRPEGCSLPLRSGFLGECRVNIEAAEAPPPPPPEWHRIIKDTVGCYRNGVYADGEYAGSTEGCIEIHAGRVFLLQPVKNIGGGRVTFQPPLTYKFVSVSNGVSSLTMPTNAFDRTLTVTYSKWG
jgi:hypothetical protein